MVVPTVDELPTAPDRGAGGAQFDLDAAAWAAAIGAWTTQVNALGLDVNSKHAEILAAALAGDLPPLTGHALKLLRVNAGEAGVEFFDLPLATALAAGVVKKSTSPINIAGVDDATYPSVAGVVEIIGVQVPSDKVFNSGPQTIISAGLLTMAHGLAGITPSSKFRFDILLECIIAQGGYTVGHHSPINVGATLSGAGAQGTSITWDATNFYVRYGALSLVFQFLDHTTGARYSPTNAYWNFHLRAELDG